MPYPPGAVERAMKVHEVIMRALDGQLTWIQAAEILGRSPRSIRRLRGKLQRDVKRILLRVIKERRPAGIERHEIDDAENRREHLARRQQIHQINPLMLFST